MPSSQRPFFLSSFLAAFRQQPASALSAASSQANKHHTSHSQPQPCGSSPSGSRSLSTTTSASAQASASSPSSSSSTSTPAPPSSTPQNPSHHHQRTTSQLPLHSPRAHGGIPIPVPGGGRRRGSDSSSEGFRDVLGGEKWYIGGRTAGGEERFFKLGVVRRVRSQDRLSLDRLSL